MRINQPVTGKGIELPDSTNILSTTDPDSYITYVNPDFIKISGFDREELIGQPQNIVRHPDMPPIAFEQMWSTIKSGKSWMGMVKNRCKNGDHYWVSAYVSPVLKDGRIEEYQSVRTKPDSEQIKRAEAVYKALRAGKANPFFSGWFSKMNFRTKLGLVAALLSAASSAGLLMLSDASATTTTIGPIIASVVTGTVVWLMLAPLSRLAAIATRIADNEVSQSIYTRRSDEFGSIELSLKMMQSETSSVIGRISDSARRLSVFSGELVDKITQSNKLSEKQKGETEQVATAINQMVASIQDVASNAQSAADSADKADKTTQDGNILVSNTSASISELADQIRKASTVIKDLEKHSSEITTILSVIRDVAEQTNLLALNAAIEAARAGEQGRGFAVVADEVRNLASRTQDSTLEISNMITKLQEGAQEAVQVMDKSLNQAEGSVSESQSAADSLSDIGARVNEITEMNIHIATAVEQQRTVSEQIDQNVTTIRRAADDSAEAGVASEKAVSQLSALSQQLDELAQQFWAKEKHF